MPQTIAIKWGSKNLSLEVEETMTCKAFMEAIQALTGVPVASQKVIGLKGILKPTEISLQKSGLKKNQKVVLIGHLPSKTVVQSGPEMKFVEDLSNAERAKLLNDVEKHELPIGIKNLGVTCYMNSCIQALRAIEPIRKGMVEHSESNAAALQGQITMGSCLNDLCKVVVDLDGTSDVPVPTKLIASMRLKFPELARKATDGQGFMQQDVDEFWMYLTTLFGQTKIGGSENLLTELFTFQTKTVMDIDRKIEGQESILPDYEPTSTSEEAMKIQAFMGTATSPITLVQQGMKLALTTSIEKRMDGHEGDVKFSQTTTLMTLPKWLNIHFARFAWKQNDDGGVRAKVTRRIAFSASIDLYDFCDEELKKSLGPIRNAGALDVTKSIAKGAVAKGEVEKDGEDEPMEDMVTYPDGSYDLVAVITHEGRTADSGHYVCWRKKHLNKNNLPTNKNEQKLWLKFDDDKVTEHPWDSLDLCGGRGDFHMAYLTFWEQRTITVSKSTYDEAEKEFNDRQEQMEAALAAKNKIGEGEKIEIEEE